MIHINYTSLLHSEVYTFSYYNKIYILLPLTVVNYYIESDGICADVFLDSRPDLSTRINQNRPHIRLWTRPRFKPPSPAKSPETGDLGPMLGPCRTRVVDGGATLEKVLGECPVFVGKPRAADVVEPYPPRPPIIARRPDYPWSVPSTQQAWDFEPMLV